FVIRHIPDDLVFIYPDVVFADFIKGMFEVILDVIKADEDEAVEHRHNIFEIGGEVVEGAGEIGTVDDRKDINKNLAVCPQGDGCSIRMNKLQVVKGDHHLAHVLADTRGST